ncbi:MAG: S8 family serine peptidase, partial [Candidatus Ranarchaeia archaeon]
PNFMTVLSPGGSPAAITVGAYDFIQDTVPDFSSRGSTFNLVSKPDVIAPGINIVGASVQSSSLGLGGSAFDIGGFDLSSATDFGDIGSLFGGSDLAPLLGGGAVQEQYNDFYSIGNTTAASAAIVAGAAALVMERSSLASVDEIRMAIQESAQSKGLGYNVEGNGLINVTRAASQLPLNPLSVQSRSAGLAFPYFGVVFSTSTERTVFMVESQYALSSLMIVNHSRISENITSTHMLIGNVYIAHQNLSATALYFSEVRNPFHYVTLPTESYSRNIGVLQYENLLIIPLLESWAIGNENEDLNSFKMTLVVVNIGNETVEDVEFQSIWKVDLFSSEDNAELDDLGSFNSTTNTLYIEDTTVKNETDVGVCLGLNSSIPMTNYEVGNYSKISGNLDTGFSNTTENGNDIDVGWGTTWTIGDIAPFENKNFSFVLGIGDNKTNTKNAIDVTWEQTPTDIAADLSIIDVDVPRNGRLDSTYHSTLTVMNLGTNASASDSVAAFIVNQTLDAGGTIFASYKPIGVLPTFNITYIQVEWNPEYEDIYAIGWIVASSVEELLIAIATGGFEIGLGTTTELYLLDNLLLRDVFVGDIPLLANLFPNQTPYAPYHLDHPTNFGLYTSQILTTFPLLNVSISITGNASDWISLDAENYTTIESLTTLSLTVFVPPIIPAATYVANITLSSSNYGNLTISFETSIEFPKARILVDTVHNKGFDLIGGIDMSGGMDDLLTVFSEMSDSIYTGYYEMYRTAVSLGFALTEIPTLDTLNNTFLPNFDGLIILDPEEEFTLEEQAALSNYIEEGNPVLFFANDESESTANGLNNVFLDYGIEVFGNVNGNQTSSFNTSEWPELFEGISSITFYKATSILSSSPGLISLDS